MNNLDFDDAQQFAKVLEALLLAAAKPLSIEHIAMHSSLPRCLKPYF